MATAPQANSRSPHAFGHTVDRQNNAPGKLHVKETNCWLFIPHRTFPLDGRRGTFALLPGARQVQNTMTVYAVASSASPQASAFASARGPFATRLRWRLVSMSRSLPMAARLLSLQAAAQAAHIPVAKTVVMYPIGSTPALVGRWSCTHPRRCRSGTACRFKQSCYSQQPYVSTQLRQRTGRCGCSR